jgi:fructokinase
MDILCLGEVLIDMFPAEIGRAMTEVSAFRPKPGGAPANVAVAAARLGTESGFIGKVGDDTFGHFLENVLKNEGVDTQGIRFDPEARTTLVFIAMPDVHNAEFVFYRNPGADMLLQPEELPVSLLQSTTWLHFGSLSLIDEPIHSAALMAIEIARQAGALISFDVNYRPALWSSQEQAYQRVMASLPFVDLVKVNQAELALLTGSEQLEDGSRILLSHGSKLCVVTTGADGSYFNNGREGAFVPGFKVDTVDATGCGDAFVAGLLTQLVETDQRNAEFTPDQLKAALRYANAVGALTALTQGVIPALPNTKQVEDFLVRQEQP